MISENRSLQEAARDFRYFLNRGYPRKASLELVGNRYALSFDERHLLHRGIFSDSDARLRTAKKVSLRSLRDKPLAVDGHNILITVESALSGRPLISSNDGFIRDISGISGQFRKTETTDRAFRLIVDFLKKNRPSHTLFLFDAPISRSGLLAQKVRKILTDEGVSGDARAVPVPEETLIGFNGIVATSDTAIIDRTAEVFDLAGHIIKTRIRPGSLLKLKI